MTIILIIVINLNITNKYNVYKIVIFIINRINHNANNHAQKIHNSIG